MLTTRCWFSQLRYMSQSYIFNEELVVYCELDLSVFYLIILTHDGVNNHQKDFTEVISKGGFVHELV